MVKHRREFSAKENPSGLELNCGSDGITFSSQFLEDTELFDSKIETLLIDTWDSIDGQLDDLRIIKAVIDNFKNARFSQMDPIDNDESSTSNQIVSQESKQDMDEDDIINTDHKLEQPTEDNKMDETMDDTFDQTIDETLNDNDNINDELDYGHILDEEEEAKIDRGEPLTKFQTSLILLYAVNTYFQSSTTKNLKVAIKSYISSLSCEILNGLLEPHKKFKHGFKFLFEHHTLKTKLYTFLNNTFIYPTKAQIDSMVIFHSTYASSLDVNVQNYLQVFICKELFKRREYHSIYKEIKDFNIHQPEEIETYKLDKKDIFIHYYILAKSCMVADNFPLAFQLFQTMILSGTGIKFKDDLIQFIMAEYIVVLMKLERTWKNKDFIFLKYFNSFPTELVDCYRYFSMGDYSRFIKIYLNFAIKTLPVNPHEKVIIRDSNMIMKQKTIFTDSLLRQLCVSLLKRRFSILNDTIMDEKILNQVMDKDEIHEINNVLTTLGININMKKILTLDIQEAISSDKILKKSFNLMELNSKLNALIENIVQGIEKNDIIEI